MSENGEEHSATEEADETPTKNRKRSAIWNYFAILSKTCAQCTACDRKLAYGRTTANLNRHLRLRHPTLELEPCYNKKEASDTPAKSYSLRKSTENASKRTDSNRDAIFNAIDKKELEHLIMEKESYLKSLQILKLERELGLPCSKYTTELIAKTQTIYVLQDGQLVQRSAESFGENINIIHDPANLVGVQESTAVPVQQPQQHIQQQASTQMGHQQQGGVHHYVAVSAPNSMHGTHIVGVSAQHNSTNVPHIVGVSHPNNPSMPHVM